MGEERILSETLSWTPLEGGFSLTARLSCPLSEARCLAVAAASWVREAAGEGAKILWPNHVVRGGERLCAITCRGTAEGVVFTFRPTGELAASEAFRDGVLRAAEAALKDYPGNQPALLQAYCEHCLTIMKFVNVTYRGVPLYGFAFAVDRHGGLMVMTQESRTVVTLYGGEAEIVRGEDVPPTAPEPAPSPRV